MRIHILLPIILLFLASLSNSAKEVDTFNVLLPQINSPNHGRPIQLVSSEGACFQWATTAPQILKVTGISNTNAQCYRKALIQLTYIGPYPASIYLTAINGKSDQPLNVPVRIRSLKKITVVTKSRMMNINQRQDLTLYGYDSQENRFTSLEGFKFKWDLIDNLNVLEKISLKDSHLILPLEERKQIQSKGFQSDIIVVKGLIPGKVTIKVSCIEPGYEYLHDQIIISVHERFDIIPSLPSYILVDSSYQFALATPAGQPISLPRSYYKSTINKQFVAQANLLIKTPKTQSQTTLKVQDIRTSPSYSSSVQIFAKVPDQIKLIIDQYILVGEHTPIAIELYWNKRILKGKSSITKVQTSLQFNEQSMTVKSTKKETVTIRAVYNNVLQVTKTIHSVLPLKGLIPSSKIHLPLDESYELKIVGGSNTYDFKAESDHISVSNGGFIVAKKEGQTFVTVSDKKLNHYIKIPVIVSRITNLSPLQYNKELNKHAAGPIFISALNSIGAYTECDDQHMSLEASHYTHFQFGNKGDFRQFISMLEKRGEENTLVRSILRKMSLIKQGKGEYAKQFQNYVKNKDINEEQLNARISKMENYGICQAHLLKSYKQFQGYLEVYLKSNINIRNKFKLRVYKEIINQIQQNDQQYFIMTPLSSLEWKTSGGSYQWLTPTKIFLNNIEINTRNPRIECPSAIKYLEMKMEFRNPENVDLIFPVNQSKIIKIDCKFPNSIKIKYQQKNMHENNVYVIPSKTVRGWLYPLDSKSREFYNSSNLIYHGQTDQGSVLLKNNYFEFQNFKRLKSKVVFSSSTIKQLSQPFPIVQTYFIWQAAEMFTLSPIIQNEHLLTMFNPKQSYQFDLLHSSNYIETQCTNAISCAVGQKQHKFIRVSTIQVGDGKMLIRDKWLYGMPEIAATLQVVQANYLMIKTHRSSIEVQRSLPVKVQLYNQKRLIPAFQYPRSQIQLIHDAGIRVLSDPQYTNSINTYFIKGDKSGIFKIQAEQHSPKFLVSSNHLSLIVFEKVTFNIANLTERYENQTTFYQGEITVPINCMRRVKVIGGPENIQIQYSQTKNAKIHRIPNKKNRDLDIEGIQEDKGQITIKIIQPKQSLILSVLTLFIKTSHIQKAVIYSLDQALMGAQFRLLPHLLIDQKPIIDSQCQLRYEWNVLGEKGLSIVDSSSSGGINVTAIRDGETSIQLNVLTKKKDVLLKTSKVILIHKSLDINLPTLIGQSSQKISTNMLIPPKSGYEFQSHHSITKISQCQQNLILINSNKIHTTREKGIVSVKIKNHKDETYNSYMNVIVTEIKGLFIENFGGKVNLQIGEEIRVKFYVFDMYGRLFYNNLINVDYSVFSSNEEILTASISHNKEHIILHPHRLGSAKLLLRQIVPHEQPYTSTSELLKTPHDIIEVEVGKILEPVSPIYVHKGGVINFIYTGDHLEKWQVVEGQDNVKIDEQNRRVYGEKVGESIVSINGLSTIIRVIEVNKVQQLNQPADIQSLKEIQLQYNLLSSFKDSVINVASLNQQVNHVNNNLNVECRTVYKNWFDVTTQIRPSKNGQRQQLYCMVKRTNLYPDDEQIPRQLIVAILVNGKVVDSFDYPLHMMFMINKKDRSVLLSKAKPNYEIKIKTAERLKIDLLDHGEQNWYTTSFSEVGQVQIIKVAIPTDQVKSNKHFRLSIYNSRTGQNEEINIRYIIDGGENQRQQEESEDKSWLQNLEWTDFIIFIMGVALLIIMGNEYLNKDSKYKVL